MMNFFDTDRTADEIRDDVIDEVIETITSLGGDLVDDLSEGLIDLGLDSLDMLEMRTELEDTFDINLPEGVVSDCESVDDLVDIIVSLLK